MIVSEPAIAMDFSESAFRIAIGELEISPEDATIWIPAKMIARAYLVQQIFKCQVVAIPNVLTKSPYCWGVADNKGALYWSAGLA